MKTTEKHMAEVRKRLTKLINNRDSLAKPKVLEISQELDKIICKYIKIKKNHD